MGSGDLSSAPRNVARSIAEGIVDVATTLNEGPLMNESGLLVLRHWTEGIGEPTATHVMFRLPPRSTSSTAGGGIVN
jgi:hypothetical protein